MCDECQRTGHLPAVAPLQPWEWPERLWIRLHLDFAGPFLGLTFFFFNLVDTHSKWIEVHPVTTATNFGQTDYLLELCNLHLVWLHKFIGIPLCDNVIMNFITTLFVHVPES